jgi:hypothetical protein
MWLVKPWHAVGSVASVAGGHCSLPLLQSQSAYEKSGSCANSPGEKYLRSMRVVCVKSTADTLA